LQKNPTKILGDNQRYGELISRESDHWGAVKPDPLNPQIWEDDRLFEIFFGREYRLLIDRVLANGQKVLELGCGEGNLSLHLAQRGMTVTGIDLSPERIARAELKARNQGLGRNVCFVAGDLNTLSLEPCAYDCIVAHDALHHMLAIDRLLDEVKQSLKPNGRLIVQDYIGMGKLRKIIAAALFAFFPTYQPYWSKWQLRSRLFSFLANEKQKRHALENSTKRGLHQDSPFEEISQDSIVREITKRFAIVEFRTFNPFWYYLAPKVRFPKRIRYKVASMLRYWDEFFVQLHLARGAYFFIEARNRS
jgi:2-polyprenyl-3-methyl-5-hydroxy-6-metoxy-1,4-benzoquinol methylase